MWNDQNQKCITLVQCVVFWLTFLFMSYFGVSVLLSSHCYILVLLLSGSITGVLLQRKNPEGLFWAFTTLARALKVTRTTAKPHRVKVEEIPLK